MKKSLAPCFSTEETTGSKVNGHFGAFNSNEFEFFRALAVRVQVVFFDSFTILVDVAITIGIPLCGIREIP